MQSNGQDLQASGTILAFNGVAPVLEAPPAWQASLEVDPIRSGGDSALAGADGGTDLAGLGGAEAGCAGAGAGTECTGDGADLVGAGAGCGSVSGSNLAAGTGGFGALLGTVGAVHGS